MKRHGGLLAAIADPGNLRLAFWKASKGKRAKADCRGFQQNLDANLAALRAEVLAGRVRVGDYHYFTIHDPKERTICTAHFLAAELRLVLKPNVGLNRTAFGMDFLGYRVFPQGLRLARRSKLRFARKFRRYEREWVAGRWTEMHLQQRMQALVAFTLPARSRPWRRHVLHRFGVVANGLESRDPRRQLEQQRQELPVSEAQQQQPGQPEQQHRFPGPAGPSSSGALDGAKADPAAILSPECAFPGQTTVEQGPV